MKTRFSHRFQETPESLKTREWVLNTSIDDVIKELESKYRTIVTEKDKQYDLFEDFMVKHWFYCSASAPTMNLGFEWQDLERKINTARAGDIIEIWILTEDPKYFKFKCPNQDGLFPNKGAY